MKGEERIMVKCINVQCTNHGYELEDTQICPICGTETERFKAKPVISDLCILAVLTAIASIVILFNVQTLFGISIAIVGSITSIVMAVFSKKKMLVVFSILSLIVVISLTILLYGVTY